MSKRKLTVEDEWARLQRADVGGIDRSTPALVEAGLVVIKKKRVSHTVEVAELTAAGRAELDRLRELMKPVWGERDRERKERRRQRELGVI